MKFLLFLLLGTLIFGFAFPAFIIFVGLFAFALFVLLVVGTLRGGRTVVYTNRDFGPFRANGQQRPPDGPEVIDEPDIAAGESASGDFEDEGEIIELPASALRKDEDLQ